MNKPKTNTNGSGMTLIVKTITRLTVGLILIYGIYIAMQGHLGPGGGFAGGVIIALSFIHLMLAFGKDMVLQKLNEARGIFFASAGSITLITLAVVGFISRKHFPTVLDVVIAVIVGSGLFTIFLALVLLTISIEKR